MSGHDKRGLRLPYRLTIPLFAGAVLLAFTALVSLSPNSLSQASTSSTVSGNSAAVLLWGDVDCDGQVSIGDALKIGRHLLDLEVSQMPDCPPLGGYADVDGIGRRHGDIGCTGAVGIGDAVRIARYLLNLPFTPEPGCPRISSPIHVIYPTPIENGYELVDSSILSSFPLMVDFVRLPGLPGQALVLTQNGHIHRIWLDNSQPSQMAADLSTRDDPDTEIFQGAEDGLLSLAFDPRFPDTPHVYIYYSRTPPPGLRPPCVDEFDNNPDIDRPYHSTNVLSRFTVDPETLVLDEDSEEEVLVLPDRRPWHNGGGLLFGPDSYLYLSLGDEGGFGGVPFNSIYFDPCRNAQDTSTLWGSVIRIDVLDQETYAIPPDNPLVGQDGLDEIWAWGFRNPWRMNFDEESGDLWTGDVGQSHYEEINRVVKGGNYGWPVFEGSRCWDDFRKEFDRCATLLHYNAPRTEYCRQVVSLPQCPTGDVYYPNDGFHLDCSVIGGHVYRGAQFPELHGWYVYADFCSGRVRAFDTSRSDSPSRVIVEAPSGEAARFISAIEKTPDGELLFVSYDNNGFYRLEKLP